MSQSNWKPLYLLCQYESKGRISKQIKKAYTSRWKSQTKPEKPTKKERDDSGNTKIILIHKLRERKIYYIYKMKTRCPEKKNRKSKNRSFSV